LGRKISEHEGDHGFRDIRQHDSGSHALIG
jgi:hypothetical protein